MSLSTYADLQTAVSSWLKRADMTTASADLITLGETWIYRHARTRDMETSLSVVIAAGVAALPSNFIALKNARISGNPDTPLAIRPAEWIYDAYPLRSATATPKYVGVEGANLIFGPYPDAADTVVGTYYKTLGALSASNHALFTNNPNLYLFAALAEAEAFVKNDERVPMWIAKRDAILMDVNKQAQESSFGGGLAVRVA